MSHAMSSGPWSRIKRKIDHPLPSPPASISFASNDSSPSSSSSSSSSSSTMSPSRTFCVTDAESSDDNKSVTAIFGTNALVTRNTARLDCDEGLCSQDTFRGAEETSSVRSLCLVEGQAVKEPVFEGQSHLLKSSQAFNLYQSNSHKQATFHMSKLPNHQNHSASFISACEIDFGPGGTIRRKPSIHLNNPKLPLVSATTRILANQSTEDSRVEIVPSSHVMMSYSCKQNPGQLITYQSQCERNHATARSPLLSHHCTSCEKESKSEDASTLSGRTVDCVTNERMSLASRAPFTSTTHESIEPQSCDIACQHTATSATRHSSPLVRNSIQYGTLKRNNSSVTCHRGIARRVSNVPTTSKIIAQFDSFTTSERISLNSLNSVESSDFSSSSSSSASSVCSSSSHGANSPSYSSSSSSSALNVPGKLNTVLAPSVPCNYFDSMSSKVSHATSTLGVADNSLPTPVTSISSFSSYSLNCSSCKCTRVDSTALSNLHTTASDVSSESLPSSANSNSNFTSATLCKSCLSETSSILSRSVSMLGEEDEHCDTVSVTTDHELLSIEKCLRQLNLGHSDAAPHQCYSDPCRQSFDPLTCADDEETKNITENHQTSAACRQMRPVNCEDNINQCLEKNSCLNNNNNNNIKGQLNGIENNGILYKTDQAPTHLRESWSHRADASPDASDDEHLLPPPPLPAEDDSRNMTRLSNLSLDSLPPPPPELHSLTSASNTFTCSGRSESRHSLDSFPPPPPASLAPPVSLPTLFQAGPNGEQRPLRRLNSFSSQGASSFCSWERPRPSPFAAQCPTGQSTFFHSDAISNYGPSVHRNAESNGSCRSKPVPPPPPRRSESTRLSSLSSSSSPSSASSFSSSSRPLSHQTKYQ